MNASSESGECASLISCALVVASRAAISDTPSRNAPPKQSLLHSAGGTYAPDAGILRAVARHGTPARGYSLLAVGSRGGGRKPESWIVREIVSEPAKD